MYWHLTVFCSQIFQIPLVTFRKLSLSLTSQTLSLSLSEELCQRLGAAEFATPKSATFCGNAQTQHFSRQTQHSATNVVYTT